MTVTAIVVLVAGVTVISIFGTGISQVSSLSSQKTSCLVQARSVCSATNTLPAGWNTIATKGKTCASLTGCNSCECILGGKKSAPRPREQEPAEARIGDVKLSETLISLGG